MTSNSFLPEDFVAKRAERRTNLISLTLFAVVMIGVLGAFLVTNRQWIDIQRQQQVIDARYQDAAKQIQELTQLEKQRDDMLNKAQLATALVERVPRSILLAELINRMPPQLGLMEFDIKSERRQSPRPTGNAPNTRLAGQGRAPTREEAGEAINRVEPPRYRVSVNMVGVAPTDLEVSSYMSQLNSHELLRDLTLVYSEQREIEGRTMRQFRISMTLAPDADVRHIEPLSIRRGATSPTAEELTIGVPRAGGAWNHVDD
jgi:hypothetical protein